MNDFGNYDPRMWLDRVLSRHPIKNEERKSTVRNTKSQLARFAFPVAAMASLFLMQDVAQPVSVGQNLPVTEHHISSISGSPVYWLETMSDPSAEASPVASFEARAAAVTQQLRAGKLLNVPAATLELARAAIGRTQLQPVEWVSNVARDVARLTD